MSLTQSWGVTNTTASTHEVAPIDLGFSNYAVATEDPGKCILKNTTSPIDQVEVIAITSNDLASINQEEKNQNPPKVNGGRLVSVKVEGKKRITSTTDETFIVDYPASVAIQFRFAKSQYITAADLRMLLTRALGALQDADGNDLIGKLMLQQLNVKAM